MDLEGATLRDISQTGKTNIVSSGLYGESKPTNKRKKKKNFLEKENRFAVNRGRLGIGIG